MIPLTLGDAQATLHSLQGEAVELQCTTPAAPGTPLRFVLNDGRTLSIKAQRSIRNDDGFRIHGRAYNLQRTLREYLLQQLNEQD